jgi:hypothetical protein
MTTASQQVSLSAGRRDDAVGGALMSSTPPSVHLDLVALWVDTGLSNRGRPPAAEAVPVIDMAVPPASGLLPQLIPAAVTSRPASVEPAPLSARPALVHGSTSKGMHHDH